MCFPQIIFKSIEFGEKNSDRLFVLPSVYGFLKIEMAQVKAPNRLYFFEKRLDKKIKEKLLLYPFDSLACH